MTKQHHVLTKNRDRSRRSDAKRETLRRKSIRADKRAWFNA